MQGLCTLLHLGSFITFRPPTTDSRNHASTLLITLVTWSWRWNLKTTALFLILFICSYIDGPEQNRIQVPWLLNKSSFLTFVRAHKLWLECSVRYASRLFLFLQWIMELQMKSLFEPKVLTHCFLAITKKCFPFCLEWKIWFSPRRFLWYPRRSTMNYSIIIICPILTSNSSRSLRILLTEKSQEQQQLRKRWVWVESGLSRNQ